MTRMKQFAVAMSLALLPVSATAGPGGGGPIVTPVVTGPVFDATTDTSGIVLQFSGGYQVGYNMTGTTTTGSGDVPAVPADYTLLASDTLGWPDLDGNGISDIVIQHTSGYTYAYLMQDNGDFVSVLQEGAIQRLVDGFEVIGWPDLDGDGDSDMVIKSTTGGFTFAYLMNGLAIEDSGQVPGLANYNTIGFPDLDGMNGADIVIQSDSGGFTFAYLMTGLVEGASGQVPGLANYNTIGFPDLDGTAGADIVIQSATGGYSVGYIMAGITEGASAQVPGLASYNTIGFPDLDGENGSDIVIQSATGGYSVGYIMTGLAETSSAQVPGLAGFNTLGFPNLDGANGADIVIQASGGGYSYGYLMDGTTQIAGDGQVPGLQGYTTIPWENDW